MERYKNVIVYGTFLLVFAAGCQFVLLPLLERALAQSAGVVGS